MCYLSSLQFWGGLVVLLNNVYVVLQIEGLLLDCSNSNALAMDLLQSYTKPSK